MANEFTRIIRNGVEHVVEDAAAQQALTGKADKVSGATSGNLAGLDGNGNLTDSGKKPGDIPSVINNLTSTSTTDALSAAQGKTLNTSISSLKSAKDLGPQASLSALQTALATEAASMSANEVKPVRAYTNPAFETFKQAIYIGYLYCNYKKDTRVDFTVLFRSGFGDAIVISRINGTWKYNDLSATPPSQATSVSIFFVFGTVKDGAYYYSNSVFIPTGYKIASDSILPSGATLYRSGNFFALQTQSDSLAGKGTNAMCSIVADT